MSPWHTGPPAAVRRPSGPAASGEGILGSIDFFRHDIKRPSGTARDRAGICGPDSHAGSRSGSNPCQKSTEPSTEMDGSWSFFRGICARQTELDWSLMEGESINEFIVFFFFHKLVFFVTKHYWKNALLIRPYLIYKWRFHLEFF